jgi:alpha-L-arabinofuranosidase
MWKQDLYSSKPHTLTFSKDKKFNFLQELFSGSKYKFVNENDVYKLIISTPKVEDTGKYTIEIAGIACTAYLDVEGKSIKTYMMSSWHVINSPSILSRFALCD